MANGDLLRELMSAKCKSETMPSLYFVPDHEEGHIPMSQVIKQQKLSLRKSLVKHSEAATFVIVPPNFLEGQIWPKDLKFYQVSPLERDFGQETLIRDENDHIEVSDSQILQICPEQNVHSSELLHMMVEQSAAALQTPPQLPSQLAPKILRREACSANSWQVLAVKLVTHHTLDIS